MDLVMAWDIRQLTDEDHCLAALTVCELLGVSAQTVAALETLGLVERYWDEYEQRARIRVVSDHPVSTWMDAMPAIRRRRQRD